MNVENFHSKLESHITKHYVHKVLVNCLFKLAQEKVWLGELTVQQMTIAVDLGRKATKQTNKTNITKQLLTSISVDMRIYLPLKVIFTSA